MAPVPSSPATASHIAEAFRRNAACQIGPSHAPLMPRDTALHRISPHKRGTATAPSGLGGGHGESVQTAKKVLDSRTNTSHNPHTLMLNRH